MKATVESWMTRNPYTVGPQDSADVALRYMLESAFRHLPVLDETSQLVGILSLDDLRAGLPMRISLRAAPSSEELQVAQAHQVLEFMTVDPVQVAPEASLEQAVTELAVRRIGSLPVVRSGELVGIFTETDAMRALLSLLRERR
jgi:acetoin utilization protein AcuB